MPADGQHQLPAVAMSTGDTRLRVYWTRRSLGVGGPVPLWFDVLEALSGRFMVRCTGNCAPHRRQVRLRRRLTMANVDVGETGVS